jgi:hypothetical protein
MYMRSLLANIHLHQTVHLNTPSIPTHKQTLCALSVAAQTMGADPEWWMHYQIANEDIHMYHESTCEVKVSGLRGSVGRPDMHPGKGLFTTMDRTKDELIVAFPGYWMQRRVFGKQASLNDSYAFTPPSTHGWQALDDMVYVTHPSQANFINAGIIDNEVIAMDCVLFLMRSYD